MKKTKYLRLLSFLCAVVLVLGCVPGAMAYEGISEWAVPEIERMEELGLVPDSLMDSDLTAPITRKEICDVLVGAYELCTGQALPDFEGDSPFTDTEDPVVLKACGLGLVNGYPDGTFQPDALLTREQFCAVCQRTLESLSWTPVEEDFAGLDGFSDGNQVEQWALPSVKLLVGLGILKGNTEGTLTPASSISREQALVMVGRLYDFYTQQMAELQEKYPVFSQWALGNVQQMDRLGMIPGELVGQDLTVPITRGEMCHMAVLAYRKVNTDLVIEDLPDSPFSDTDDPDITLAYYLGLVNGYPDGTFQPDALLTREQFFVITVNYLGALGYPEEDDPQINLMDYTDGGSVSAYAKASTRLLLGLGIVSGPGDGSIDPGGNAARQEALSLFLRAYRFILQYREDLENQVQPEPSERELLCQFALQFAGYPYTWGGSDPSTGFDCSGLVCYCYRNFRLPEPGYSLHRTHPWENGTEVSKYELEPGDILTFSSTGSASNITHVGLYIGNNQYIHAANSTRGVVVDPISWDPGSYCSRCLVGAYRIIWE